MMMQAKYLLCVSALIMGAMVIWTIEWVIYWILVALGVIER